MNRTPGQRLTRAIATAAHPTRFGRPPHESAPSRRTARGCSPGPLVIEDDVLPGAHATTVPGVTVHQGRVITAGTVVTGDGAPHRSVGGMPASVNRDRKDPTS